MKDVHAILDELIGRHLERILSLTDEAALHAVLDIGKLDAGVADRRATVLGEDERVLAHLIGNRNGIALQKTHVAVDVADHLNLRRFLRILVDEEPDGTGETRSETTRREECDFLDFFHFVAVLVLMCLQSFDYIDHFDRGEHGRKTLVALLGTATFNRLLEIIRRDDTIENRHPGLK